MQFQTFKLKLAILGSLVRLDLTSLLSQAQTFESFTNPQFSQCKWDVMNFGRLSEPPSYTRVQVEGANLLQF